MKYIATIDTDEFKDFEFFEDADGKYLVARDAGAKSDEWIALRFTEAEKVEKHLNNRWCNTCEFKHLESECLGCAEYDEHDNLVDLRNYKKEE